MSDIPAKLITIENRAGEPVTAGDTTIVPVAKVLRLQIPGLPVGLIWNRPASVVVQRAGGEQQVLPVRDITRQVQLALLGAAFAMLLVSLALRRRK